MPFAAVAGAVIGGVISSDASRSASNKQADAAREAANANTLASDKAASLQEPWRQAGMGALSQLSAGTAPGGQFNAPFNYQADPGYAFRLAQGQDALESSAAARGTHLSGGTLQALVNYGQQAGSQEFGNSYNRWNNDQTNRFNRLASVAGLGQTATRDVSAMGMDAARSNGEYGLQGANAAAAGRVGQANAWNQGLTGLGNWAQGRTWTTQPFSTMATPDTYGENGGFGWKGGTGGM